MKKIILLFCLSISISSFSQVDMGMPASTGMGGVANGVAKDWECIGVNPSNLGWENNYRFSISGLILGLSAQSSALNYAQLHQAIFSPSDTFSTENKQQFANLFSNSQGLNVNTNMTWIAFSFKVPKVGGFALNLRDRTFGHIQLNQNAAEMLFMGLKAPIFQDTMTFLQNISKIFDNSKIGFMHYRELNLSYGTKLFGIGGKPESRNVNFYGGAGVKYLWGMGNCDVVADNGILIGHTSFSSNYGIKYGKINGFSPESTPGVFSGVGKGVAFDLGLGVRIKKVKITFSTVDIGSITWDKNVLITNDTLLPNPSKINFSGIKSWDISKQFSNMINDNGPIHFKPGPAYTTTLPAKFRVGLGWQASPKMILGTDMVMPLNGNSVNLPQTYYAVGGEWSLASNLKFSFGLAGNPVYKLSVPFGITLERFFKIFELRLATNNILTYISPGSNPNISLSISLFRFNLKDKEK